MKKTVEFGVFDFHIAHIVQKENCSLADACKMVAACGCRWVECGFDALTAEKIKVYRDNGLQISNIYCFLNFEHDVKERICALLEMVCKAAPKFVMPIPEKDNTPALQQKILPVLIQLQKDLEQKNIQMVMEEYDGPDKTFASSDGVLAYLDAIPGLKCCFDTGNFYYNGEDAFQVFPRFADRIIHCHFKDRRLDETYAKFFGATAAGVKTAYAAIGDGILPTREIFKALLDKGYNGCIIAEFAMCHDPLMTLRQSISTMRHWLQSR